ncbi:MAG: rhodanese-like domain-containing protein [Bryobacteraceae bacterium]|nr:rhodanese-like domain-containing protein [Bryobacteraceae bacterium]MCX7605377.1 rhodanese-like domain-containing protein [Bryobacteraceae bacterium]
MSPAAALPHPCIQMLQSLFYRPTEVSPAEARRLMQEDRSVQFVDVREHHERMARHIPGTLHIPLGELPRRLHQLDPARPVIVHCKSGARSAAACHLLEKMGFRQVYNLRGGIDAWG